MRGKIAFFSFCLLALLSTSALADEDYYELLNLPRDANERQVKKAARKLSLKYHPDRTGDDPVAKEMYIKIRKAAEVLSDKKMRQIYDMRGVKGLEEYEKNKGQTDMFGNPVGMKKGPNYQIRITVSLEELYSGANKEFRLRRNQICTSCRGTGAHKGHTHECPVCKGRGFTMQRVQMMGMIMNQQQPCQHCRGEGRIAKERCHVCSGRRVVPKEKQFDIVVEKGMKDGDTVVFEGESEQSPDHLPGDVIFIVQSKQHHKFQRRGDDLHMRMELTLEEALLGFKKSITHLDGHEVQIQQSSITQPNFTKQIVGEGMPRNKSNYENGDLFIKFLVRLPKRIGAKQTEILHQIFE